MDTQNANVDIRLINEKIEKESAFVNLLEMEMRKFQGSMVVIPRKRKMMLMASQRCV